LTLTAKLRSNSASVISPNGLVIATEALLTRMSHRPNSASSRSSIAWYWADADVGSGRDRGPAGRVDIGDHLVRGSGGLVVVHHHRCAFGGERGGDGLADPDDRSGHQGRFALQGRRGLAHDPPSSGWPAPAGYRNGRAARVSSGITAYCIKGMTIRTETSGRAQTGSPASRRSTSSNAASCPALTSRDSTSVTWADGSAYSARRPAPQ
jgi:hypothetical protein